MKRLLNNITMFQIATLLTIVAGLSFLVSGVLTSPLAAAAQSNWVPMNSNMRNKTILTDIWGTSSSNVFAVGYQGTIVRFNGSEWSPMVSGLENGDENLKGINGNSASNIFAVGSKGSMLRYDGSKWTEITSAGKFLSSVGVAPTGEVFAVGIDGLAGQLEGNSWKTKDSKTKTDLNDIWVNSKSDVFAVGNEGTILHFDGANWIKMDSKTPNNINLIGVWGSSSTNVFAVGYGGTVVQYDGKNWVPKRGIVPGQLYGVWGSSANDVFAVGDNIAHYDGKEWRAISSGASEALNGVWGSASNNVFAAGNNGAILHYIGARIVDEINVREGRFDGWVVGGNSYRNALSLKAGEMIRAEAIFDSTFLSIMISSPDDKQFMATYPSFSYAAETSGIYYFVVENPTSWATSRGYHILYKISPATIPLGTGIGIRIVEPPTWWKKLLDSITGYLWLMLGVTFILLMVCPIPIYREKSKWHCVAVYKKILEIWWK